MFWYLLLNILMQANSDMEEDFKENTDSGHLTPNDQGKLIDLDVRLSKNNL